MDSTTQTLKARIATHHAGVNSLVRKHELQHVNAVQQVILEAWSNGADLIGFLRKRECHWTNKFQTLESQNNGGLNTYKPHGSRCTSC